MGKGEIAMQNKLESFFKCLNMKVDIENVSDEYDGYIVNNSYIVWIIDGEYTINMLVRRGGDYFDPPEEFEKELFNSSHYGETVLKLVEILGRDALQLTEMIEDHEADVFVQ
jgi:hypothetical protein